MIAPLRPASARPQQEATEIPPAVASNPSIQTGIDNFLLLFQRELAEPLKQLAELANRLDELQVAGFLPTTLSGQQTFTRLAEVAHHSAEVSRRLLELGAVLVDPPLRADERILLASQLQRSTEELANLARSRGVGLRLEDNRNNLAPVYGSAHWLGVALKALLGLLIQAAGPGTYLQLRLRQVGFHQLLTAAINPSQPAASSIDLLQNAHVATVKDALAAAISIDTLDLVLARAIVELHGGSLRTNNTGSDRLHQFNLSLPTGESAALHQHADCDHCPFQQQAEQFAQDIGELLGSLPAEQQPHIHEKKS